MKEEIAACLLASLIIRALFESRLNCLTDAESSRDYKSVLTVRIKERSRSIPSLLPAIEHLQMG